MFRDCQERSVFCLQGVTDITPSVDTVYTWQIIEHEGKKYAFVEGESRNGIISKNLHELDSGRLIYCAETTKDWLENKKGLKEIGIDLDKIAQYVKKESEKQQNFLSSLLSKS